MRSRGKVLGTGKLFPEKLHSSKQWLGIPLALGGQHSGLWPFFLIDVLWQLTVSGPLSILSPGLWQDTTFAEPGLHRLGGQTELRSPSAPSPTENNAGIVDHSHRFPNRRWVPTQDSTGAQKLTSLCRSEI
uniref:Bm11753 n=1 Tax=Brugia malayi TaxID=6279 RepID=A0A1I9GDV7_BRUMA|nr:Bm11753 [Brugia malayi]